MTEDQLTPLLRLPKVMELTGLGKSTIWKMIAEGDFPKQVKIGPRVSAWPANEVYEWIQGKIYCRGKSA